MEERYDITIDGIKGKKGLEAVAYTDEPAIEVRGLYFSKDKEKKIPSAEEEEKILKHLADCGKTTLPKNWKEVTEEDYNSNKHKLQKFESIDIADIVSTGLDSVFDVYDVKGNGIWHLRYQYVGPVDDKNRSFCSRIMSMGKTYTYEEITSDLSNSEFGSYSIFDYKGSYGCRHVWKRVFFYEDLDDEETRRVGNIVEITRNLVGIDNDARTLNAKLTKGLSFVNTYKMRVCAPALIPDIDIYRNDENGEYYVTFSKEEIEKLVVDFQKKHIKEVFNVGHDSEDVAPAYILESWIIEDENDKAYSKYGFDKKKVPIGSWMITSQITDEKFFQKRIIEEGNFGYSVEGIFNLELKLSRKQPLSLYSRVKSKIKEKNMQKSNIKTMLRKQKFKKLVKERFGEIDEKELDEIVEEIVKDEATTEEEIEKIITDVLGEPEEKEELEEKKEEKEELEDEKKEEELEEKEKEEELEEEGDLKSYLDSKFNELIEVISKLEVGNSSSEEEKEEEPQMFSMAQKFKSLKVKSENK